MARRRPQRRRIGRVYIYSHHGSWWAYYRNAGRPVRKRLGEDLATAERLAAAVNAQLTAEAPTLFDFQPTTVAELQREFLDHHEYVTRSSLATVSRYRSATQHLVNFSGQRGGREAAHDLDADAFLRYLRAISISPNGHAHSRKRPLRDKGVRYILDTCRSMYGFAARHRRLPPYLDNPFAGLGGKRFRIEDAKRVFVFGERQERDFLAALDDWAFPIHFALAKTGLRPGELVHLLIEDVDLEGGWLQIWNRPELGWQIKSRRERQVPLIDEAVQVVRRLIGSRSAGPVFLRATATTNPPPLDGLDSRKLVNVVERRIKELENRHEAPSRGQLARVRKTIWRDAGAVCADQIRLSFIRCGRRCGVDASTCPKSWRHTFATLLQDANVDPLVRQLTLGHAPAFGPDTALGMTALYTHTRPETQKREVERALRQWPASLDLARKFAQGEPRDEAQVALPR